MKKYNVCMDEILDKNDSSLTREEIAEKISEALGEVIAEAIGDMSEVDGVEIKQMNKEEFLEDIHEQLEEALDDIPSEGELTKLLNLADKLENLEGEPLKLTRKMRELLLDATRIVLAQTNSLRDYIEAKGKLESYFANNVRLIVAYNRVTKQVLTDAFDDIKEQVNADE